MRDRVGAATAAHGGPQERPWASGGRKAADRAPERPKRAPGQQKVLECLTCGERHSREDVLSGLYQISTMVCSACYARMQAAPRHVSCFGKTPVAPSDGTGYDPDAPECRDLCPDRALCASVAWPPAYNPETELL